MADQKDKPASNANSKDAVFSETIAGNKDAVDDWGEAFISEEEASSPFFLEETDDESASSPTAAGPIGAKSQPAQDGKAAGITLPPFVDNLIKHPGDWVKLYKNKFLACTRPVQVAVGAGLAVILIGLIFFVNHPRKPVAVQVKVAAPPIVIPESVVDKNIVKEPAALPQYDHDRLREKQPGGNTSKPVFGVPLEKGNKKWHLPLFYIAVTGDNDKKTTILTVDLTLLLLLPKDELPPQKVEIKTRDIIFQFFNNQPLSEIKRYSLARGDMKRSLRAWIEKQMPDLPISAIVFNHYQML